MLSQCPLCALNHSVTPSTLRLFLDFLQLYIVGLYEICRQLVYTFLIHRSHRSDKTDHLQAFRRTKPIIILTGANSGIGHSLLQALSTTGSDIITMTHNPHSAFPEAFGEVYVDFSCHASTQRAAQEIAQRLDSFQANRKVVLVQCAGVYYPTSEGNGQDNDHVTETLKVNVLMPCVFLQQLGDKIHALIWLGSASQAASPRISHSTCPVHAATTPYAVYPLSKLLGLVYAEHWSMSGGKQALVVHPGVVATHLYRNEPGLLGRVLRAFVSLLAWSAETSARRVLQVVEEAGFFERMHTSEEVVRDMPYTAVYYDAVSMARGVLPEQIRNKEDRARIAEKLCKVIEELPS